MRIFLLLFLLISSLYASPPPSAKLPIDIFLTSTCAHCQAAHRYFSAYQKTHPEVDIHFYWINQNKQALQKFHNYLTQYAELDFSVPAFFFCDTHWNGFSPILQQELIKAIQTCQTQLTQAIPLKIISESLQQKMLLTSYFNKMMAITNSIYIIPIFAMLDAINPCSLFSIIVFFILVGLQKIRSDSLKIGAAWLVGMSIALVFNMLYPELLRFFLQSTLSRILAAGIGIAILFYIYQVHFQSTRLVQLSITLIASSMIHAYQQTCQLNLTKLFPMWVAHPPSLSPLTYMFSVMAYTFFYLFIPICLYSMLCYSKKRQFSTPAPYFIYFNTVFLSCVALILIIQPSVLSSFSLSFGILILSSIASLIRSKWSRS